MFVRQGVDRVTGCVIIKPRVAGRFPNLKIFANEHIKLAYNIQHVCTSDCIVEIAAEAFQVEHEGVN